MSEASEKHHIACSIELQDIMVFVTSTVIDKAKQHKNLLTKDSMKDGKSAIVAVRDVVCNSSVKGKYQHSQSLLHDY